MLTVTEIRCIPTADASTRGHDAAPQRKVAAATQTAAWNNLKDYKSSDLHRRFDQATQSALSDLATDFTNALPADISLLSGGLRDSFSKIVSAMFALSVCDSGIDLHAACISLGSIAAKYKLLQSWYDPDQVQATVCFCADYGYDLNTTRQQLYASLYAALLGVLSAANLTTDRGQICDTLGLFNRTAPSLGIDIQQYHDLVCTNVPSANATTPIWYGPTPIVPFVSGNMTTWGTPTSWMPNMTILGTGTPTSGSPNMTISGTGLPGSNVTHGNDTDISSTFGPPLSFTGTIGSGSSVTMNTQTNFTALMPTGTGPASETAAASETGGSASKETLIVARTPRGPMAMPFYPAVTTSTTHSGMFKGY